MAWTLAAVAVPVAWLCWSLIHETAHLVAIKSIRTVTDWAINPFPHNTPTGWRWAGIEWRYVGPLLKPTEAAGVSLAPRVPDALAAVLTPVLAGYVDALEPFGLAVLVFAGAGLVDLAVGSVGLRENSDLRKASAALGWSPWKLRSLGAVVLVLSLIATFHRLGVLAP